MLNTPLTQFLTTDVSLGESYAVDWINHFQRATASLARLTYQATELSYRHYSRDLRCPMLPIQHLSHRPLLLPGLDADRPHAPSLHDSYDDPFYEY